MRKALPLLAISAAVIWAGLTTGGCGGCGYDENKVIVTIDGKPSVTVGDFVYHYKRAVEMAPPQDKPVINTFDDAKDFLDDITTSRVLEVEAEGLGYGDNENLKRDLETYRSSLLRERTRRKIEDKVKITEAEILDYYNKNKEWRRVSFLMCKDKAKADKAYAALEAGKPWAEVVKEFSDFEENRETGGKLPSDFYYSGDNMSRAVYETEVGKYTPVTATEQGDAYFVFRVDEKIPGQKEEYAQVKDNIRNAIKQYKVEQETVKYIAEIRKDAEIWVDQELYDAVVKGNIAEAQEKYNRKGAIISKVGDIPVYFDSWYEGMFLQLSMNEAMIEEYKKREPEAFKDVMDSRLKALQDDTLFEYDAVKTGVDKDPDFIRDINRFRAGKMVDRIYEEVFLPTIPEVTDAEVKEYFDNHPHEFQEMERAEIFLVAFPDKKTAEEVRAKTQTGMDITEASNPYLQAFVEEMQKEGAPEEQPAPGEIPVAQLLSVTKEPAPEAGATAPEGGENPILEEIRPVVFKAKKGDLSELFELKDGRWAFFDYWEYYPFVQHTMDEEGVAEKAKDGAYREKMASPEVDRKCQAWFEELRKKHKIEVDEGALKMAYKKVQKL